MLVDDLAELLGERPGLTAPEITEALAAAGNATGIPRGRHAVDLALSGAPARFWADRSDPPRWRLAGGAPLAPLAPREPLEPPVAVPRARPGAASAELRLLTWQAEALAAWVRRGRRGVVEAVTGTGKTVLGIAAVAGELTGGGQALVLVPTVELMHQWRRELLRFIGPGWRVGCLGGTETASLLRHDVVVAVVNSARDATWRPIRRDALLVADECHRYASAHNRLALSDAFGRRLGLSATYARDDGAHLLWLEPYFGGTCFEIGYARAIAEGVTARFALAVVGVELPHDERSRYDELTSEIGARTTRLVERHGLVVTPFAAFLRNLALLASAPFPSDAALEARALLTAMRERRRLLAETPAKLDALAALVPAIAASERSIVFTQSIAAAEAACRVLGAASLRAGTVHSGLTGTVRAETLSRFAAGTLEVITAPRVLDEGIDVPEADLAVVLAASASRRQMIQRMGRVLRRKAGGRRARIAVVVATGTIEDLAGGGAEAFLPEAASVADEVREFRTPGDWATAATLLSP